MSIKFVTNSGEGKIIAHAIRQFVIANSESWRPIAYAIDGGSSIVLNSKIIQSSANFLRDLNKLRFASNADKDLIIVDYEFRGSLSSTDLTHGEIVCLNPGIELLQSVADESFIIRIFYRKACGVLSIDDNYAFLQDYLNEERLPFPVSRSVHHSVLNITYNIETYDTYDKVTFVIGDNVNEAEVITTAINTLVNHLSRLQLEYGE